MRTLTRDHNAMLRVEPASLVVQFVRHGAWREAQVGQGRRRQRWEEASFSSGMLNAAKQTQGFEGCACDGRRILIQVRGQTDVL